MPTQRGRMSLRGAIYVYGSAVTYARDMESILSGELFCDTRFLVGHRMQAMYGHKCVIASRCDAISAMLLPNAGEVLQASRTSHLLKDIEPETFRVVLHFLYTNSFYIENFTSAKLIEIFRAALKFQLPELTKLLEALMIDIVDENTVFDLLNVAVAFNCTGLTSTTMEYILHNAKTLLKTENPEIGLLSPDAIQTILSSDELPMDELTLFYVAAEWSERYRYMGSMERALSFRNRASVGRSMYAGKIANKPQLIFESAEQKRNKKIRPSKISRIINAVMSRIRYALLSPANLRMLEENPQYSNLIPPKCLSDAWRIISFKFSNVHPDERLSIPTSPPVKRGTKTRTT